MDGLKREVSVVAEVSYSLSVEFAVFVKSIAYESAERHRVKSLTPTPGIQPLRISRLRSLSEQHFHDLRKC
jgi:hypothetical protein